MDAVVYGQQPVLVGAGMDFEARLAEGPGVIVVYGQNRCKYRENLHYHARNVCGIISFGVAGGLSPSLSPGDVVVASSVITARGSSRTSAGWSKSLLRLLPGAHHIPIFGAEKPAVTVLEKEALWSETGAGAVDMESGAVAEAAAQFCLPYAVLRVVLDPASRALPPSALAGAREDGTTDAKAVVKALMKRPQDFPALMRLAEDNRRANDALLRCRQALGPLFGFGPLRAGGLAVNAERAEALTER
jgi:hopanoid-associated phosphorylase